MRHAELAVWSLFQGGAEIGFAAPRLANGVTMAFEMRDTPTTAFTFISDNAGNAIELIEHKTR